MDSNEESKIKCGIQRVVLAVILLATGWHVGGECAPELEASSARWVELEARYQAENTAGIVGTVDAVFLGSSSIRMWDLDASFPGCKVINRGLGGATVFSVKKRLNALLGSFDTDHVVLYVGENDIAFGCEPADVMEDIQSLVLEIMDRDPSVSILIIEIKTSPARVQFKSGFDEVNWQVMALARRINNLKFIESKIDTALSGNKIGGQAMYFRDRIHLSDLGYAQWTNDLKAFLQCSS